MSNRPLAASLVVLGAAARLLPHPPNFTPVGSISLLAGARLRGWEAYGIPLALMVASDLILSSIYGYGFFGTNRAAIYTCFLINVLIGRWLRGTENFLKIGAAAFAGSLQFFLVTNFMVWLNGTMYAKTVDGLLTCYAMALPFYGRTLAGDLFFSAILFGLHAWLSRKAFPAERPAAAAA